MSIRVIWATCSEPKVLDQWTILINYVNTNFNTLIILALKKLRISKQILKIMKTLKDSEFFTLLVDSEELFVQLYSLELSSL